MKAVGHGSKGAADSEQGVWSAEKAGDGCEHVNKAGGNSCSKEVAQRREGDQLRSARQWLSSDDGAHE